MTGKCASCGQNGITLTCPSCYAILGVSFDPIAIRDEILEAMAGSSED